MPKNTQTRNRRPLRPDCDGLGVAEYHTAMAIYYSRAAEEPHCLGAQRYLLRQADKHGQASRLAKQGYTLP